MGLIDVNKTLWFPVFLALAVKAAFGRSIVLTEGLLSGWLLEIALLAVLLYGLSRFKKPRFWLAGFDFVFSFMLLAMILYFDYYNAILTYKTLAQAGQLKDVASQAAALMKPEYLILFADFPLLPILWRKNTFIQIRRPAAVLFVTGALLLLVFGVKQARGTVNEIHQFGQLGFLGYQAWTAASGMMDSLSGPQTVTPEAIASLRPSSPEPDRILTGAASGMNLILIQLESVQQFLVGLEIGGQEVTPALNRLADESFQFPHFYSQVGKGNTSDAEFIANTSVYPLGDVPMSSAVKAIRFEGLPARLSKEGYLTATFHANDVSFWNRQDLYRSLQFGEFYDKAYFGAEDPISYGASDEVLYKKTLEKLVEFSRGKQPFYAHIISLSSHFPYDLPDLKTELLTALPEEYSGTSVGSYIQAVRYADYALGQLLDGLKKAGLYDRSVLAVYGDHQGLQIRDKIDAALVSSLLGHEYDGLLDHLNVPLIIRVPGVRGWKAPQAGGTVDIYPTLANLLGLPTGRGEIVFGSDLLNTRQNVLGFRFYAPLGSYMTEGYGFTPGKSRARGHITQRADRSREQADENSLHQFEAMLKYLKLSDAYVKQRMKEAH